MNGSMIIRNARSACIVAVLAGLGATTAIASDGVYQMEDGLLVIELESADLVGDWALEKTVGGHTGSGYLRWTGPDYFGQPGHGVFGFDFHVPQGGTYDLRLRNHHDHPDSTEENDVWVRVDGGTWTKCFSSIKDVWTWSTYLELPEGKPPASYQLSSGQHRIEFSGRSHDFRIDRMHLFTPGHPGGQDPSQPESEKSGSGDGTNRRPVARLRVTPDEIRADDGGQTVVTLDGGQSFDPDDGQALSYEWHVPGAHFVNGTSKTSAVAQIVHRGGGKAVPVRLAVTDDAAEPLTDVAYGVIDVSGSPGRAGGALAVWHPLELAFEGPLRSEAGSNPNPFLDYRLVVTFRGPAGQEYDVHGFYDGDGAGGGAGRVWKVRFSADEAGAWSWRASFRKAPQAAISQDPDVGQPLAFDGAQGWLVVLGADPEAEGFLAKGRLEYVGEHYLRFRNGEWFVKGGTDSPENFLGYAGFDDVEDQGNIGIVHQYAPHVKDWRPGDPYFVSSSSGVDSKGIIGALNYLGEQGVNSIYFLPMNLGGDGQETCPFIGYGSTDYDKTHYDVSRLHQWAQVLDHAQRQGILLHFVLAETEWGNENWLDGGGFGVQRKLFFRELVARFGHVMALKWNLSEENDFSIQELEDFAAYIRWLDPYDHPIGVHTHPSNPADYPYLLGNPNFTSTSIQYATYKANQFVEEWRQKSAQSGHPWVLDMDENGTAGEGLTDKNADYMRKEVLYDVYFSGGQVEWYAGYHSLPLGGDVRMEDFRTREAMWTYMRHARELLESLPFHEMKPADELLTAEHSDYGGGQVFAKPGHVYAVYLPCAVYGGTLDLTGTKGKFDVRWFDPRTGQFASGRATVSGGGAVALGTPPGSPQDDWVVLLKRRGH